MRTFRLAALSADVAVQHTTSRAMAVPLAGHFRTSLSYNCIALEAVTAAGEAEPI